MAAVALMLGAVAMLHIRHIANDECGALIIKLRGVVAQVIRALNYSEPYGNCAGGCTSRFYDAYRLLKDNVTTLINLVNETGCVGLNLSQLRIYVNYALNNLTTYNPANPLGGVNESLRNMVNAYYLLSH
ncbi:MAG: hypothetical protein RXQ00_00890 [Caldivirga sp.]